MADIEIKVTDLVPERLKVTQRQVDRAVTRAGSDAIKAMRAEASRGIRKRKAIKAGKLTAGGEFLTLIFPTNTGEGGETGKSASRMWRLKVRNVYAPVFSYPTRQTKKGVSVAINKGGRALIRHAFIATMKSGHQGVFMRYGTATRVASSRWKGNARYAGQKRQPIRELYSSKVIDVFGDEGMIPGLQERARAVFRSAYVRNLVGVSKGVRGEYVPGKGST